LTAKIILITKITTVIKVTFNSFLKIESDIRHYSKFTIKRYKILRVKDFSRSVLNSIYDKSHYMEEDIKKVYRYDNATLRVVPLLL
jgi:hypothetical protein